MMDKEALLRHAEANFRLLITEAYIASGLTPIQCTKVVSEWLYRELDQLSYDIRNGIRK